MCVCVCVCVFLFPSLSVCVCVCVFLFPSLSVCVCVPHVQWNCHTVLTGTAWVYLLPMLITITSAVHISNAFSFLKGSSNSSRSIRKRFPASLHIQLPMWWPLGRQVRSDPAFGTGTVQGCITGEEFKARKTLRLWLPPLRPYRGLSTSQQPKQYFLGTWLQLRLGISTLAPHLRQLDWYQSGINTCWREQNGRMRGLMRQCKIVNQPAVPGSTPPPGTFFSHLQKCNPPTTTYPPTQNTTKCPKSHAPAGKLTPPSWFNPLATFDGPDVFPHHLWWEQPPDFTVWE